MIDLPFLVDKTVNFMKINNLNDLDLIQSPRDLNGCWARICIDCLGSYSFKESQYIKIIWQKNCKKFKDLVIERLNQNPNPNQNLLRVELEMEKVNEIKQNILLKPRKYIRKSVISRIISEKLQEYGINCWFVCKFNWFSSSIRKPFTVWYGSFVCLSEKCIIKANFEQSGYFDSEIIIKFTWVKAEFHREYV